MCVHAYLHQAIIFLNVSSHVPSSHTYIVYTGIILSNFSKISVKYKKNVTLAGLHGFGDSGGQELFNGNIIYAQLF